MNELSPSGNMALRALTDPPVPNGPRMALQWSYRHPQSLNVAPTQNITRSGRWPKDQSRPIEWLPPLQKSDRTYNKPIRPLPMGDGWLRLTWGYCVRHEVYCELLRVSWNKWVLWGYKRCSGLKGERRRDSPNSHPSEVPKVSKSKNPSRKK